MKISIITISLNSETTIRDTINSVLSQTYKNIEHILVDGGSADGTIEIIKKYIKNSSNKRLFIKKNMKLYDSINYGIKKSTGDYIFILHSDDIFNSNFILDKIINKIIKYKKFKIFLGNVNYFKNNNFYRIVRIFKNNNFKIRHMKYGLMPPHTGSIINKEIYEKYGYYKTSFKLAADFELFLRFFFINKIKFKKLDFMVCRMRAGGLSGKNLFSYIISTIEIIKSFRINNIFFNSVFSIVRLPIKLLQIRLFSKSKYDKEFQLFKIKKFKEYYNENSFQIYSSINKLNLKKNFILSGMNLAFLGYFGKKILHPKKNLYHWPDGVWIKKIINMKKIPGRQLLKKLKLPKNIKRIKVLGNLTPNSKKFLEKKFKKKIIHIKLPYGNINKILYKKKIFLKKNEITLITLPTPKQEIIAFKLSEYNKFYKIICIGASIALASGEEKIVPKYLSKFEFLWRLRTDFFRRSHRMIETLFYYLKAVYSENLFNKTRFFKID